MALQIPGGDQADQTEDGGADLPDWLEQAVAASSAAILELVAPVG